MLYKSTPRSKLTKLNRNFLISPQFKVFYPAHCGGKLRRQGNITNIKHSQPKHYNCRVMIETKLLFSYNLNRAIVAVGKQKQIVFDKINTLDFITRKHSLSSFNVLTKPTL